MLLLINELVTNAQVHGAPPVVLRVAWGEDLVRVEVEDQSPVRPVVRKVSATAPDGRGMLMVEGLSQSWGVLARGAGKAVWFTV